MYNEAQIEALANANAFLNNAGLPLVEERILQVEVRNVYGKPVVYPSNKTAELFAAIAGTKTLSTAVLANARQLGFDIKQVEAYPLPAFSLAPQ